MSREKFADRKDAARSKTMPQYLAARGIAESASNSHRFAVKAELINEVLYAFITQLYEVDQRGEFLNVDVDGRLRLRVPWRKEWRDKDNLPALRDTERTAVRMILEAFQSSQNRAHLFEFSPPSWYVRLRKFPSQESALEWVDSAQITATMYNAVDTKRRTCRRGT